MSEAELAALARRQHGAFNRAQANACGLTDRMIGCRVRSGLWIPAHAGVYLDAAVPRTNEQSALAACLACGDGAVASHTTAGVLLGLDLPKLVVPEVTVAYASNPRRPGIRIHRSRHLGPGEVARIRGVPITNAARTLTNLSELVDRVVLAIALDTLWRRGLVDPERLSAYLAAPHRAALAGTGLLRALAAERIGQRPPGSDLETIYFEILRSFNVPLPVRQHPVRTRSGQRFIDLAYPKPRVAIELKSFGWHARDKRVFEDDNVRQNDLELLGWRTCWFTWEQCANDPVYAATTTAEAIGLVPVRWASL